jgi:hypothetical protein
MEDYDWFPVYLEALNLTDEGKHIQAIQKELKVLAERFEAL